MTVRIINHRARKHGGNMLMLMLERLRAKRKRRALRKSLLNYDNHMLRDIGLARHQVLSDEF